MQYINKRTLIWGGIALLVVIAAVVASCFIFGSSKQEVSTDEPVDIVNAFYDEWLAAAHSTTTNPYQEGLAKNPLLSKELRKELKKTSKIEDAVDPVLCQRPLPEAVSLRSVYAIDGKAEVLVTARRSTSTEQSIVTLLSKNDGWYIDNIRCSLGEFAPEREFSFDREGFLLKSVPEPLNSNYWHLIFTENDIPGHYAPLFFSEASVCQDQKGAEVNCDPDGFMETAKAHVQGEMTELGVQVKRLKMVK